MSNRPRRTSPLVHKLIIIDGTPHRLRPTTHAEGDPCILCSKPDTELDLPTWSGVEPLHTDCARLLAAPSR